MKFINKLRKKTSSMRTMYKYYKKNRDLNAKREMEQSNNVHISLTSYGKRINKVFYTIESLMVQDYKFSSITLYLSEKNLAPSDLPQSLIRLQKRGLKVVFVKDDYMSYKKLFYSYGHHLANGNLNARLVTADDDVMYDEGWLTELVRKSDANGMSKVVSHRNKYITMLSDGEMNTYKKWTKAWAVDVGLSDEYLLFPTGVGGVLYPMASLKGLEKHAKDFMSVCKFADDIWFKCLTLSNGYVVEKTDNVLGYQAVVTFETKRRGLAKYNVHQNGNDVQMKAAVKYFREHCPSLFVPKN